MHAPALTPFSNQKPGNSLPDPLTDLEARIARRADEIAATLSERTPLNLYCWLQAEQEVLARLNILDRWPGKTWGGPAA